MSKCFGIAAVAALMLAGSAQAQAVQTPITYQGSDTEYGVTVDYSITTDGTLGLLSLANIVSTSETFTGNGAAPAYQFSAFTGHNNLYFINTNSGGVSPVSATATDLFFNFAGGGTFNIGTADCAVNNVCDNAPSAAPNSRQAGLVLAFAGAQSTDDDNIVFHGDNEPDKEIDDFYYNDFNLRDGTYTLVPATNQSIARVAAATTAVPEPASWALMLGGFGLVGSAMRRRRANVSFV